MALRAYSTKESVRRYLPKAIILEGENTDPHPFDPRPLSVTDDHIEYYIAQADNMIDARLASIYDVPLRHINLGGHIAYPPIIEFISAVLAAWMIWQRQLSGTDKASSDFIEKMYSNAQTELDNILNGYTRLNNQNAYIINRTISADLLSGPYSPVKEPSNTGRR